MQKNMKNDLIDIDFSRLENNQRITRLYHDGRFDEALKLIIKEFVSDHRIQTLIE